MGPRMSTFDRFSLKENGRILSLKLLERIKGRQRATQGYLPSRYGQLLGYIPDLPDRSDPCPFDPTNTCVPIDSDRNGIPDYADECPTDPTNTCDQDIDSDNDGINDEFDPCPFDPTNNCSGDFDSDGIADESDPCPFDPTNTCGNGVQ